MYTSVLHIERPYFMQIYQGKLTSKGQITLPRKVREHLHLRKGDVLEFTLSDDHRVTIEKKLNWREFLQKSHGPATRAVDDREMHRIIEEVYSGRLD